MKYALFLLIGISLAGIVYIRLAPLDSGSHHLNPVETGKAGLPGHFLVRTDGDASAPSFEMSEAALAEKLEAIILSTPRTEKLAGDIATGHASYVTRSAIWRFPDIASVRIIENPDGSVSPVILSRLVYGKYDLGVNEARVRGWLQELTQL